MREKGKIICFQTRAICILSLWEGAGLQYSQAFRVTGIGHHEVGLWVQKNRSQRDVLKGKPEERASKDTGGMRNRKVVTLCEREFANLVTYQRKEKITWRTENVSFVSQGKMANYFVLSLLPSLRNLAARVKQEWSASCHWHIFNFKEDVKTS